jgi:hypothetical protein
VCLHVLLRFLFFYFCREILYLSFSLTITLFFCPTHSVTFNDDFFFLSYFLLAYILCQYPVYIQMLCAHIFSVHSHLRTKNLENNITMIKLVKKKQNFSKSIEYNQIKSSIIGRISFFLG